MELYVIVGVTNLFLPMPKIEKTINKCADIKQYLFAENSELITDLVSHLCILVLC